MTDEELETAYKRGQAVSHLEGLKTVAALSAAVAASSGKIPQPQVPMPQPQVPTPTPPLKGVR